MEVESRVPTINTEGAAQKVIRQQLVLLLHAHSCQQKASQNPDFECNLPYCQTTKNIIDHMRGCNDSDCNSEHCYASQQIIAHWKHCAQKKRCQICGPVFVSQISNALNEMNN